MVNGTRKVIQVLADTPYALGNSPCLCLCTAFFVCLKMLLGVLEALFVYFKCRYLIH